MKKNVIKKIMLAGVLCVTMTSFTSCVKPYDTPEFTEIEPSQTAFLVPLTGNTANQASFESEEMLSNALVATKRVQIPHEWVQTKRWSWQGEWRPTMKLIVVERKPETREWNTSKDNGTSVTNQAIYAESKESIGFSVGMNCSAQIYTEQDAVKFLYSYNNTTLASIMDSEIRARVESKFVEECAKYSLNEILENKDVIMQTVRNDVETYFAEKGITITVLGMKDGIEYDDAAIQTAINEKFSSEQKLETQENNNAVIISKAEAEAEALKIAANAEAEANKKISESLTDNLIDKIKYEKWNGEMPYVQGNSTPIIDISK